MKVLLDVAGAAIIGFGGLTLAIYTGWFRTWASISVILFCALVYFSL